MQDLAVNLDPDKIPRPYDQEAARQRLNDARSEMTGGTDEFEALLGSDPGEALAICLFGNSPFLATCMTREPEVFFGFLQEGPDRTFERTMCDLERNLPGIETQAEFMQALRIAKRQVALTVALADITGLWSLDQVTAALSRFAQLSIDYSVAHLLRARMRRGDLAWTVPEDSPAVPELTRSTGYFILAMGKLGGGELNYSSDVDLIVLFDSDIADYRGRRDVQDCFIRVTRDLVKVMQERTEHGYVFRVDLRLRPDPGATPVALSAEAAEIYYQSMGLNWERSAMIKARPVAGDFDAGHDFLNRIKGFVWRKHLDYAALDDIYAMKDRIHAHHGHSDIGVAGQNIKLGAGGIREIEFFAQAQQLISGGRDPDLRVPRTLDCINVLQQKNMLDKQDAADLCSAYRFLRTLEHRLQMVRDEQTQTMPDDPEGVEATAVFMGLEPDVFETTLVAHLERVKTLYDGLLADTHAVAEEPGKEWERLFRAEADSTPDALLDDIESLGFAAPEMVADTVRSWAIGRYRALRTERARGILRTLTPAVLAAFGATAEPDRALRRFDEFLGRLPSGVQIFSLLQANPKLLELLATVLGTAPALADFLGRNHLLLDSVLSPGFMSELPDSEGLAQDADRVLTAAVDFQDVMDLLRRWANEHKFRIGVQILEGLITAADAAAAHTRLAEAVIRALLPAVEGEFSAKHGRVADGGLAVVAMGSFGGCELTFTSDLDMIFVYDSPSMDTQSDGARPLPAAQYFGRLSQRLINAITALTGEGRLYEVDMRLRPSGNAGPVAVSVAAFDAYQSNEAWTWEHMALTRARPVAGPETLQQRIAAIVDKVLSKPRDPDEVLAVVADMRRRIAAESGIDNLWGVKHVSGGLLDVEFIAQYHQLRDGAAHPDIFSSHTATALENLRAESVISKSEAEALLDAAALLDCVRGVSRQCLGGDLDPQEHTSQALQSVFARAAGYDSFAALESALLDTEQKVAAIFEKMIVQPASALESKQEQP